jgi:hypothetical protein
MQMLQIIVYEDPIPTRLLLNHHSAPHVLRYLHGDAIRRAKLFPRLRQRLGILVLLPYRTSPPFALATCRALESEEATAIPPSALATCRALEEEEAMAKT